MKLPERLLSFFWGGGAHRPCYNVGENCQHVLLIGACFIQCWCVVVLVHTCLFNHPPLFLSSRGWGLTAGGGSYSRKDRRWKNRVFCYCPIRGWQYVYIYIVYMWWKRVGFLCDTTFYLYFCSTFSVSVLIIYICGVFFQFFFFFFQFCLCHFWYFISSYSSLFLFIARFITFVVQWGDTATLCIRSVL